MRIIIITFLLQFFWGSLLGQLGQVVRQTFFPVKINKQWGMMDAQGKVVIPPRYDAIGEFKKYGYATMQRNEKIGLINRGGREILSPKYDDIKILDSLLFAVLEKSNWVVINIHGQTVLKNGYEQVQVWRAEFVGFRKNKKWGLADFDGNIIAYPKYDEIELLENDFFQTKINGKLGIMTLDGEEILANKVDAIEIYNPRLLFFQKNKKWGAVNHKGQQLIRPSFQSFFMLSDNFIKLISNNRAYLYSVANEKIITKGQYESYFSFSQKKVLCKNNRKLGLIDWLGNELLSVKYDEIQAYGKNQFRANIQGKWGVVSTGDKVIIPFEYEYITPLKSGICVVKKNQKWGVLNFEGKEQVQAIFDKIKIENNQAKAYQGEVLTIFVFDKMGILQDENHFENHFTLKIGGKKRKSEKTKSQNNFETIVDKSDYLLDNFEWYYDAHQDKWGLRKLDDGTVHIEPVFDWIRMEREVGFTLVGIEKTNKYSFDRTTYRFDMVFGLVNNVNGLLVTSLELLDVRLSDFKKGYSVARVVFENGTHGLVTKSGAYRARDFAFIDDFQGGAARMSMKGRLSGNLKNKNKGLGKVNDYLHAILSPNYMTDFTSHDQEFRTDAALTCQDCEWGYIDTSGKIVITPQYSFVEKMVNQVGIVEKGKKTGAVHLDGSAVLPCQFDKVCFLENTNNRILQVYRNNGKYGLIDTLADIIVGLNYDQIGRFSEDRLAVFRKGRWGFVNLKGQEIIPCRYRKVNAFQEGYAAVQLGNQWGFIDKNGKIIIEFKYRRVGNFKDGLAWVVTGEGVGYINDRDEKVIRPKFDKAYDFEKNVARVVVDGKYGLINKRGEYFLKPKYNHIEPFNEHDVAIVRVRKNQIRYGLLNRTGGLVSKKFFKKIAPFKEGLAVVNRKNKYGFIDPNGHIVIDCQYSKASNFSEGLAAVQKNGKCGFVNKKGKKVIPLHYSRCLDFEGGKAIVYKGMRKAGVIDRAGNEIIPPSINGLVGFSERRGLIRDNSWNYHYITDEALFYEGYYDYARAFEYGIAIVKKDGKWGIINRNGMPVISPKYDKIETFENGYAKVRIDGFSGLTDLDGKVIVPPDFEYISYAGSGLFRVEQGDKVGYFNSQGEWVWELQN